MKVATISDTHGNLVALDTVLRALDREHPDRLVSLGDDFATGPNPHEVLERLKERRALCVIGNHEDDVLNPAVEDARKEIDILGEIDSWCYQQLTGSDKDFLRTYKPTLEIPLGDNVSMLAFHGSPRLCYEQISSTASDKELETMLSGKKADVMAGGHMHRQLLRRFRETILMNPGSVGLPVERVASTGEVRTPPWAEYAVVTYDENGLDVAFRRVPIDFKRFEKSIFDSSMPHKETYLKEWTAVIGHLFTEYNLS